MELQTLKFGRHRLIVASACPGLTNLPERGVVRSREPLFGGHQSRLKLELPNFVYRYAMSTPGLWMTNHPRGQGHMTRFKFLGPNDISATAEATDVKFCTQVD